MTDAKKLKRSIRERTKRTGESYAAARRQVLAKVKAKRAESSAAAASKARSRPATGTVSEAKCVEKTGYGFDHWFALLDKFGAPKKGHTAAARHLREEHNVSPWYCQAITVSYERARDLRTVNQACAGDFQVSVSRVLPTSFAASLELLETAPGKSRWYQGIDETIASDLAKALRTKGVQHRGQRASLRFSSSNGKADSRENGKVEIELSAHQELRSRVMVRVTKLADAESVECHRDRWRQSLDHFRDLLKQTPE